MQNSKSSLAALTLGAIGVVYGDIGTSVLYAVKSVFGTGREWYGGGNGFLTRQAVAWTWRLSSRMDVSYARAAQLALVASLEGMLVKPEVAAAQIAADLASSTQLASSSSTYSSAGASSAGQRQHVADGALLGYSGSFIEVGLTPDWAYGVSNWRWGVNILTVFPWL